MIPHIYMNIFLWAKAYNIKGYILVLCFLQWFTTSAVTVLPKMHSSPTLSSPFPSPPIPQPQPADFYAHIKLSIQ